MGRGRRPARDRPSREEDREVAMTITTPKVAAVMTQSVVTVGPDATVAEVAEMLHRHHITGVPVVNDYLGVVGVVSESDLIGKRGRTAGDIMTAPARTIGEDAALSDAAGILLEERIRRLPVVHNDRLVGLISRTDLVTFFARHQWVCGGCGSAVRGLEPPAACPNCEAPAQGFRLEDAAPGM